MPQKNKAVEGTGRASVLADTYGVQRLASGHQLLAPHIKHGQGLSALRVILPCSALQVPMNHPYAQHVGSQGQAPAADPWDKMADEINKMQVGTAEFNRLNQDRLQQLQVRGAWASTLTQGIHTAIKESD